ncbi:MAG: nicotinamide mononucleotide transporter [Candidatus Gastranaerophilales bacterium]|nr:nicotinamide mononucleotide transporter [Candidatus Gastranaerophilales bacterium]
MNLFKLIKEEFKNFGKYERILFPLVIFLIIVISIIIGDNKIALVSAVCGISYTILAGKGKISCYFIGMIGTFCYSYLSFVNGFFGNLALYMLYYFPMEIIGIYKWKKHLKKEVREVIKTRLTNKERVVYFSIALILSLVVSFVLKAMGDSKPLLDGTATVLSVIGQFLTVKRCIEQWYVWFFVNLISLIMWIFAYLNGSNCLATILMWAVYLVLSIYFLQAWKRELAKN